MVTIVAATAQNNALGKNNSLIWHLADDLKRFKQLTLDGFIVMGRKTFESLPGILPRRTHIVISRNPNYKKEDVITVGSLEEALEVIPAGNETFIIGGGEIYALALDIADRIELTKVHESFEADTFFPEIDPNRWELVASKFHPKDEKHKYDFTFETYHRK